MALEKVSEQVRLFIRENEQRSAADLLMQAFRDKNPSLFNIAVVQQANIKKLADQSAAGILSSDEISREQAKTNAALLHLSDEYARLYESATPLKSANGLRWVYIGAALLSVLLLVFWLLKNAGKGQNTSETFALEVYLHDASSEEKAITDGQVNVRLGETILQSRLPLDAQGRATFKELSGKFSGDSVQLLYFPSNNKRFKITQQSAATLSGTQQTIRFALTFQSDTTLFEAGLRDAKGRAIADAQITIDGTLHASTDAKGYFKVAIPKANGATAFLEIEKGQKRLFKQEVTISSGYHEIPID